MKNYLLPLFFLTTSINCHGQQPHKSNQLEQTQQQRENIFIKKASKVIIKFTNSIFVKLEVTVFSKDSVIVKSTFVNNSSKGIYLYKPLLPADDLLKENVFGFMVEDKFEGMPLSHIQFSDSSEGKYYEGSRQYNPSVIPDLKPENFLLLQPNDSIKFTIDISEFYDLKSAIALGFRHFSIGYTANMPSINNNFEQIFEKRKVEAKAIFINIGMPKANENDKYLYQRTFFSIK